MKKIFVITDNKNIYKEFKRIIKHKDIKVEYFCSSKSSLLFSSEIKNNEVNILSLKEDYKKLIEEKYYLGFSCHSKQLFPSELVNSILCINIHPGLNPYNRGWFPQVFSIINKLPVGATIHVMDEEIDHGEIIVQEEVFVESYDTSLDIYNKILLKEIELFEINIDHILNLEFNTKKPLFEGNYNSIQDYRNLCQIDLDKKVSMGEAIDYLRALTHLPYKNAYFIDENGKKIYITINLYEEHDED